MARTLACENSSTSEGASVRLAFMNSEKSGTKSASSNEAPATSQNSPMSRFLAARRRTTWTQRSSSKLSMVGIKPLRSA